MEQPLSREQAIKEHRKMWNWIADEQEKHPERTISKEDYFNAHPEYKEIPYAECWCCEYVQKQKGACYSDCPIEWEINIHKCNFGGSPYLNFIQTINPLKRERYARQIANLPERHVEGDEK